MSQKYPEGAIIVTHGVTPLRAKVLGVAGDVRFLSDKDLVEFERVSSVDTLMRLGWTVEETPWVPKEGEEVWALGEYTLEPMQSKYFTNISSYTTYLEQGRLYRTEEEAQAAAERVRKAYRGE